MPDHMPLFADRRDAGQQLATCLKALNLPEPVVYAQPRGGVPLAVEECYIGVIYRPDTERMSHYSQASLPEQYNGFVWFDKTRAVAPVTMQIQVAEDETYPFGL